MLATVTEKVEDNLYSTLRALEETILLLNNICDHFADENEPKLAALYFKKAKEAGEHGSLVRQAIQMHERLSKDGLLKEGKENENKKLNSKDAVMPVS